MSQIQTQMTSDPFKDHLVVTQSDGNIERFPLPEGDETVVRIGRELDNDVILTDPRASRHHAEVRRQGNVIEIKDLGSANGVLLNDTKIEADTWTPLPPNQTVQLAETKLIFEKAKSSQSTVVMARQHRDETKVGDVPPRAPRPVFQPEPSAAENKPVVALPVVLGIGVVIALLVLMAVLYLFVFNRTPAEQTAGQSAGTSAPAATVGPREEGSLNQQSTSIEPTATPTPTGPQLAIPLVDLTKLQVSPIIFGASPSTNNAYLFISVRVRNTGNIPFIFSISNFSLKDRRSGKIFTEAGANTSELYLKQLGAIDRFTDLALTPGGSVPGSLVFELDIDTYDLELIFDAPDVAPVVIGPGTINMRRELNLAAGTPAAALDEASTGGPSATATPAPPP